MERFGHGPTRFEHLEQHVHRQGGVINVLHKLIYLLYA